MKKTRGHTALQLCVGASDDAHSVPGARNVDFCCKRRFGPFNVLFTPFVVHIHVVQIFNLCEAISASKLTTRTRASEVLSYMRYRSYPCYSTMPPIGIPGNSNSQSTIQRAIGIPWFPYSCVLQVDPQHETLSRLHSQWLMKTWCSIMSQWYLRVAKRYGRVS